MWEIRIEIFGRQIWENGDIQFSVCSGLLISSHSKAVALFFIFFRGTTGQIQTPEPIIRPIHVTDQSQLAMTLRLGCILSCHKSAAALLPCSCAAAIHTLHRVESECDVSFRC